MTDRVLTVPNLLSFLRLLGVPLFIWLVLAADQPVIAFFLLAVAGATDWLDGWLARRLQQTSRLGALLDPLVDRLYIAAILIVLAVTGAIPWWLVIVIAARDVMLLFLMPRLRRAGLVALPVTWIGKAATWMLMWGFPFLLLGSIPGLIGDGARALGWAFALWGVLLYWWAGVDYVRQAAGLARADAS